MPGKQGSTAGSPGRAPRSGSSRRTRVPRPSRERDRSDETAGRRGQSTPLGLLLVLAIVLAGTALTVSLGGEVLASTESQLDVSRASATMTQFDSQAAMVALGNANGQQVSLPAAGDARYRVAEDAGWVSVTYRDYAAGTDEEIMDRRRMGAVVFESDDRRIAYQGGGVWRQSGDESVMVSPPEFHYRNATLTFPFVTVRGDPALGREATITPNGTVRRFPDPDRPGFENPLTNGRVWVTVQSEYYEAWGTYFETRTDGEVEYDHANERITLELVIPNEYPAVTGGVVSGAPSGTMVINNEAGLDSYDSRVDDYDGDLKNGVPDRTNSDIVVAGDLEVEKADVYGDLVVGRELEFTHNHATLHDGNVSYGRALVPADPHAAGHWTVDPDATKYWKAGNASVDEPDSVTSLIDDRRVALQDDADNDNDADDDVDDATDRLDCTVNCIVDGGAYHLEEMHVTQDYELNASRENVTIVVDGDLIVDNGVELSLYGDHRANIYVEGDVVIGNDARVTNAGDDAPQFWLYTNHDATVELTNGVDFTGVVYGPGVDTTPGTRIVLKQNAQVFGGVVGDLRIQNNNVRIHYDEALAEADAVVHETSLPALTFLHVTENRVGEYRN